MCLKLISLQPNGRSRLGNYLSSELWHVQLEAELCDTRYRRVFYEKRAINDNKQKSALYAPHVPITVSW